MLRSMKYLHLKLYDLDHQVIRPNFEECVSCLLVLSSLSIFLTHQPIRCRAFAFLEDASKQSEPVLVHCVQGPTFRLLTTASLRV